MNVLVTGANGFIGGYIVAAIADAGFEVTRAVRQPIPADDNALSVDFNEDTSPDTWISRLSNIDAVINCAGILHPRRGQNIHAVHHLAPAALFQACACTGVRRVIQVSAVSVAADTEYARSKRAGDEALMQLDLDWVVVRPSLVYAEGSYGGMSLVRALAAFPVRVPIIGDGRQPFRPIHARDLAAGIVALLRQPDVRHRVLEPAGPEEVNLWQLLSRYRAWLGLAPARPMMVPRWITRGVARLGNALGDGPVNTTALKQLEHGNSTESDEFERVTGVHPHPMEAWLTRSPSHVQDRWHARLYLLSPWVRLTLGLLALWIGSVAGLAALPAAGGGSLIALAIGVATFGIGFRVLLRPASVRAAWLLACVLLLVLLGGAAGLLPVPGFSTVGLAILSFGLAPLIAVYGATCVSR